MPPSDLKKSPLKEEGAIRAAINEAMRFYGTLQKEIASKHRQQQQKAEFLKKEPIAIDSFLQIVGETKKKKIALNA